MIKFSGIHLSLNGKAIFQDLSLEINRGDKVVLLGKSGSGKSSLLRLLLGFIEPGKGEIIFDGARVDKKTAWNVRKKTAYVDQDVSIGEQRVLDLINSVSEIKANSTLDFNEEKINDLLSYFELADDIVDKEVRELSGGERQRLAIVISLLLERDIFLLDEITSSLDKPLKKKVAEYFLGKESWTCLVISHDSVWLAGPAVKVFDLEDCKWRQ